MANYLLGADSSGKNNNWTVNSLAASDAVSDSPTENFATLNSLDNTGILSEGNLRLAGTADSTYRGVRATLAIPTTGKWYWETEVAAREGARWNIVGMATSAVNMNVFSGGVAGSISYGSIPGTNRRIANETTVVSTSATIDFDVGDIIQCAYDADTGKFWFGKNNAWWDSSVGTTGEPASGSNETLTADTSKEWMPYVQLSDNNNALVTNFGQDSTFAGNIAASANTDASGLGSFKYAAPTGFKALCTANLPEPNPAFTFRSGKKPSDYFNTVLYLGNASDGNSITGVGFKPDLVWTKTRDSANEHAVMDSVRGTGILFETTNTYGDITGSQHLASFDSDGFTLNSGARANRTGENHVGWCWKAGDTITVNTVGDQSSNTSVNTEAGFSIATYSGDGVGNFTVGHGLNSAPEFLIVKRRDAASNWYCWHTGLTSAAYVTYINLTNAEASEPTVWNSTAPSSSVFTIGTDANLRTTGDYVAYCWHSVPGFSKFGTYSGNNNANGPFIYLGFRPALVVFKRIDSGSAERWNVFDTARTSYNVMNDFLAWDAENVENVDHASINCDFVSNGFKIRGNNTGNNSTGTFIYMAFAEDSFNFSNAR